MTLTFPSSCHPDEWSKISLARNDNQLCHAVHSYIILLDCTSEFGFYSSESEITYVRLLDGCQCHTLYLSDECTLEHTM